MIIFNINKGCCKEACCRRQEVAGKEGRCQEVAREKGRRQEVAGKKGHCQEIACKKGRCKKVAGKEGCCSKDFARQEGKGGQPSKKDCRKEAHCISKKGWRDQGSRENGQDEP